MVENLILAGVSVGLDVGGALACKGGHPYVTSTAGVLRPLDSGGTAADLQVGGILLITIIALFIVPVGVVSSVVENIIDTLNVVSHNIVVGSLAVGLLVLLATNELLLVDYLTILIDRNHHLIGVELGYVFGVDSAGVV